MDKQPCVYILASRRHGTLYTGVTSNLLGRIYQHREKVTHGFTAEHEIARLVWFEVHEDMSAAILREKRIKKWNRDWKLALIERSNPQWVDLAIGLGFQPSRTVNGKR
ncbi:GIY-YIG nuclease family protein [Sphingomonas azotifigens]|uniref:GIY-YIG nuclease family protein n=1 Tax=Sphingomonas azotifigens TaxID=330920 RepID=UPI0009FCE76A|nr:GIY-YIG nuclease family protein [Sphingomonas azotifigens]